MYPTYPHTEAPTPTPPLSSVAHTRPSASPHLATWPSRDALNQVCKARPGSSGPSSGPSRHGHAKTAGTLQLSPPLLYVFFLLIHSLFFLHLSHSVFFSSSLSLFLTLILFTLHLYLFFLLIHSRFSFASLIPFSSLPPHLYYNHFFTPHLVSFSSCLEFYLKLHYCFLPS